MKPNKILLITDTTLNHGGAETYCAALQKLLHENGYKTKLIGGESGVGLSNSFFSRWFSIKYYKLVQEAIRSFEPDIVHVHNVSRVVSPSVIMAASILHVPIVQTVHDYHYICPKLWMVTDKNELVISHDSYIECLLHHLPKKNILYALSQALKANIHTSLIKKHVTHFICPSRNLAQWYGNKFDPDSVSYLPLFVSNIQQQSQRRDDTLLFVGRLSKEKGVDTLLRSLKTVINDVPRVHLIIIGEGPEKESLRALAQSLEIDDHVQFLNKLAPEDITAYYGLASAVVIPSSWIENCPMVALESIACGCPIIASNSGGLTDLVQDGTTGYLFQRNNQKDLTKKICTLLCDKALQKKFSSNQKHVALTLSKEKHIKELEQIYQMYL